MKAAKAFGAKAGFSSSRFALAAGRATLGTFVASAAALEVSHLVRVRVQQSLRQGILPSPVEK